jgi:hypothetical protein
MSHRQSIEIPVIRRLLNRVAGSRTDKNGVAAIDETFGFTSERNFVLSVVLQMSG